VAIDIQTRDNFEAGAIDRPVSKFEEIRIQVPFPCQAKCAWCSTWKKNDRFNSLYQQGISDDIMDFYAQVVKDEKPVRVMLSGGEPILYPGIHQFLEKISTHVDIILF